MRRLTCERIKRHLDEIQCDWCGGPVYVGDRAFYLLDVGAGYCSERCAAADLADVPEAGAAK